MSPLVTEEDIWAVSEQMRSMWISRGERVKELESLMAEWVGVKYAVCLGSGTAALVLALKRYQVPGVDYPENVCDALPRAVKLVGGYKASGKLMPAVRIAVYPNLDGHIVDFARHLPKRGEVQLKAPFGIFSFGALKDVSGGLGGCIVSNRPVEAEDETKVSPLSDINAAMILSQLKRYRGKGDRLVAGGKVWRL